MRLFDFSFFLFFPQRGHHTQIFYLKTHVFGPASLLVSARKHFFKATQSGAALTHTLTHGGKVAEIGLICHCLL